METKIIQKQMNVVIVNMNPFKETFVFVLSKTSFIIASEEKYDEVLRSRNVSTLTKQHDATMHLFVRSTVWNTEGESPFVNFI